MFKKSEVQTVQVITNDNQSTPIKENEIPAVEVVDDEASPAETQLEELADKQTEPISIEKEAVTEEKSVVSEKKNDESDATSKTITRLFTSGFQVAEGRKVDTIIIHSSYDAVGSNPFSISGIIQEYKDYGVSAHYLIDRDGTIYQLVREKDIAYHAGVSSVPDGRTGVNAFSIGIELVNTKTDKLTTAQYSMLKNLISELKNRYSIKYVLGHNQIAPERKDDPWNFDWSKAL